MRSENRVPKRITYLERRTDVPQSEFRSHWATTHAGIAVDLPGVLSYRQNHVLESVPARTGGESFRVDGIVELWFTDETAAAAGFGSEVADRLIEDEPRFLSGLTGAAVRAGPPGPHRPHKLWLLAAQSDDDGELTSWAEQIGAKFDAALTQVNLLDPAAPALERYDLRRIRCLPELAISFSYDRPPPERALTGLAELAAADARLVSPQVLRAEELRII